MFWSGAYLALSVATAAIPNPAAGGPVPVVSQGEGTHLSLHRSHLELRPEAEKIEKRAGEVHAPSPVAQADQVLVPFKESLKKAGLRAQGMRSGRMAAKTGAPGQRMDFVSDASFHQNSGQKLENKNSPFSSDSQTEGPAIARAGPFLKKNHIEKVCHSASFGFCSAERQETERKTRGITYQKSPVFARESGRELSFVSANRGIRNELSSIEVSLRQKGSLGIRFSPHSTDASGHPLSDMHESVSVLRWDSPDQVDSETSRTYGQRLQGRQDRPESEGRGLSFGGSKNPGLFSHFDSSVCWITALQTVVKKIPGQSVRTDFNELVPSQIPAQLSSVDLQIATQAVNLKKKADTHGKLSG